jgi:biopolymer transport protein ExbD
MAEVQTNDHGGDGKKNKQKKQTLRVDFTPMVDMNMLLITFFMFCTTLLKPQTMKIAFPTKDEVKDPDLENKVRQSTAITILLGANDEIYYYEGLIAQDGSSYEQYDQFLKKTGWGKDSIRAYLKDRNKGTYEAIEALRAELKDQKITEEDFNARSKEIQDDANKVKKIAPTVMIKPSDFASYKNMVDALDEMLICNIGSYAIVDLDKGDRILLNKKTGRPDYLTEDDRKPGK